MKKFKSVFVFLYLAVVSCVVVSCGTIPDACDIAHSFGNWFEQTVTTPADCITAGERVLKRVCSRDETHFETSVDMIEPLGHSFLDYVLNNDASCTENGTETAVCSREGCEATHKIAVDDSKLNHIFTGWLETKASKCSTPGEKTEKCLMCGVLGTQKQETSPTGNHIFGIAPVCGAECSNSTCFAQFRCEESSCYNCSPCISHNFGQVSVCRETVCSNNNCVQVYTCANLDCCICTSNSCTPKNPCDGTCGNCGKALTCEDASCKICHPACCKGDCITCNCEFDCAYTTHGECCHEGDKTHGGCCHEPKTVHGECCHTDCTHETCADHTPVTTHDGCCHICDHDCGQFDCKDFTCLICHKCVGHCDFIGCTAHTCDHDCGDYCCSAEHCKVEGCKNFCSLHLCGDCEPAKTCDLHECGICSKVCNLHICVECNPAKTCDDAKCSICCEHTHKVSATCTEPEECDNCGTMFGEIDINNHIYSNKYGNTPECGDVCSKCSDKFECKLQTCVFCNPCGGGHEGTACGEKCSRQDCDEIYFCQAADCPRCCKHEGEKNAATCTNSETCVTCGAITAPAFEHNHINFICTTATCITDGVKTMKCSACEHTITEFDAALGHDENGIAATCSKDQVCAREECEHVVAPALGHDFADADCETLCMKCSVPQNLAGHTGGTSTCTERAICEICGAAYNEFAEHGEHCIEVGCPNKCVDARCQVCCQHINKIAATCATQQTCDSCGKGFDPIAPNAHDFGNNATCESECKNCQIVIKHEFADTNCETLCMKCSVPQSLAGHKGGTATCTERATCETCGVAYGDGQKDHDFSEWHTTQNATCEHDGEEILRCVICGLEADGTERIIERIKNCAAEGHELKHAIFDALEGIEIIWRNKRLELNNVADLPAFDDIYDELKREINGILDINLVLSAKNQAIIKLIIAVDTLNAK